MAIKDIQSKLLLILAMQQDIASDTDTDGAILDTADFELGLLFSISVSQLAAGDFELQLFESDDPAMAGATQIVAPNILPTDLGADSISVSADTAEGDTISTIGAFGNKRYVRARVVSTNSADATITVTAIQAGERTPV